MSKRPATDHQLNPPTKIPAILPWPDIPGIKSEGEVDEDRSQYNYRAVANSLRQINNFKRTTPTVVVPEVRKISEVFDDPLVTGRSFILKLYRRKGENYTWNIWDQSTPRLFSGSGKKELSIPFGFMEGQPESVGRRIGQKLVELFTKWSLPLQGGQGSKVFTLFMRTCYNLVVHGSPQICLPRPRIVFRRDNETEYITSIPFVDRVSGARATIDVSTTPNVVKAAEIPMLPLNVRFYDSDRGGFQPIAQITNQDGSLAWPSIVPTSIPDRSIRNDHEKAVRYCEYMAYLFTDTIATTADIEKLRDMYAQSFGTDRKARRGVYRGEPLFVLGDDNTKYRITASKAVRDDLGNVTPRVTIRSPNAARVFPAVDAATTCYVETGDVRQALLVLAEAGDQINAEIRAGKPPCNSCECDTTMKRTTLHACGKCLEPTICETRKQDWRGTWICKFYQIRESSVPPQNMVANILEKSLRTSFKYECAKLGFDFNTPEQQIVYEEALADLQKYIIGTTTYYDEYRSKEVDLTTDKHLEGHGRYNPGLPSVDGIFGFSACDGTLRYHCKGNVAVTALAINLMKHTHNPAMLSHISRFSRSEKTNEDKLEVLRKTTNSTLIRLKVPYKMRSRMGRKLSRRRIQQDVLEWITDKPTRSETTLFSTSRLRIHEWMRTRGLKHWTIQDRQRLMKVVDEVELEFNVRLPRGDDGCPWFGLAETMPEKWCWKVCFLLVASKLGRMRKWCNRYWKMIDNTDTLFLEIIYQACDPAYADFLGLPIVAWTRHPLCFAIAHKVHKRQMRTGWTCENPQSLSERDESKNNILMETQISNFLKHDFPVSSYPKLIEMVKEISISKALHDPDFDFDLDLDWEGEEDVAMNELATKGIDATSFEGIEFEDAFM